MHIEYSSNSQLRIDVFKSIFKEKQTNETFASLQIVDTSAPFQCEFLSRVLQPSSCLSVCVVVTIEIAEIVIFS